MRVALDRRVLGRQPERVPADRMQHAHAAHRREPRDHVADGVVAHVAHVDVARGVREHLQHVLLGLRGVFGDRVETVGLPDRPATSPRLRGGRTDGSHGPP